MRGKYFGFLVMLLVTFFMFFVPTNASSADCEEGFVRTHYLNADGTIDGDGTFCIKPLTTELIEFPNPGTCSTKTGEITKYTYSWIIKAIDGVEDSLSQVNVLIPSRLKCIIEKTCESAKDQSRKIGSYDPSTKISAEDETTDVISFDASKEDASTWSISIDLNVGGKQKTTAEFKTGTGLQYATTDGPDCCGGTEVPTAIEITPRSFGLTDGPTFNITFNDCTGDLNEIAGCTELEYGAFICQGDSSNRCPGNKWDTLKKAGPRAGAPLITKNLSTGEFESFFAYANTVYSCGVTTIAGSEECEPVQEQVDPNCIEPDPPTDPPTCPTVDAVYEVVNFSSNFKVELNSCNEPINVYKCQPGNTQSCTLATPTNLLLAIGKANGQPDTSTIFQIVAGTRGNSLLTGSSYLCAVYGIGCQY